MSSRPAQPAPDAFRELVGQAIGEASVCWDENGVFMSERASEIVDRICAAAKAHRSRKEEIEALIIGYQEAMRPLLAEWAAFKKACIE